MPYSTETNAFIDNYVKALKENNAVVFAGAGLSVAAGFFDWKKLLSPIAVRLGLNIDEEYDLTALAQYFVDTTGGRGELNQILVDQFHDLDVKVTNTHRILARLPISIYWTTNYDKLIENALREAGKTPDIKKGKNDLCVNLPKRDVIVYKMHGDIDSSSETVLTKHDYEDYNLEREPFSTAFKSDFIARTFLFIGFSFTDPNLDYLISRIRSTIGPNRKSDYYFIKREKDSQKQHRQEIRANTLKVYGLNAIWLDEYSEIETILKEVEARYLRNSIVISGSAEKYEPYQNKDAIEFLHNLSLSCSQAGYKIVSGFGLGVGSAVINGVLENMRNRHNQNLDNYIVMRPFPQIESGGKNLKEQWKEYREKFIPLAGIAIFVFGNKLVDEKIVAANGVMEEFDIAHKQGLKVIPVGATGYMSETLYNMVMSGFDKYYAGYPELKLLFEKLGDKSLSLQEHISTVLSIVNKLNNR